MKKILMLLLVSLAFSSQSFARNDIGSYSIKEVLSSSEAKSKLGTNVKFYFGNQKHPRVSADLGETRVNKKTNAFNKTDKAACQRVFLSAMIALKKQAVERGGNAIVNIKSNYQNNLTSSTTTFQCGAGAVIAGAALTGKVVTLK